MKLLEYILCFALALFGLAHLIGTFAGYEFGSETMVWSISATAFVFTIVFLHVLRIRRPHDLPIAMGSIVTTIVWIGIALAFGASADGIGDLRVVLHVAASLGLIVLAAMRLAKQSPH